MLWNLYATPSGSAGYWCRRLVDRDTETAQVERTIRDGSKLFLIGPRRFGKSSSSAQRQNDLPQGAIVIRVDADPYPV